MPATRPVCIPHSHSHLMLAASTRSHFSCWQLRCMRQFAHPTRSEHCSCVACVGVRVSESTRSSTRLDDRSLAPSLDIRMLSRHRV